MSTSGLPAPAASSAAASAASSSAVGGTTALTVVAGSHSYDVVVDEQLTVGEVIELVLGVRGVDTVTVAGQPVRTDLTVLRSGLDSGAVLVSAASDEVAAAYRGGSRELLTTAPTGPAPSVRATGPVVTVVPPGGGSSRAELATMGPAPESTETRIDARPATSAPLGSMAAAGLAAVLIGVSVVAGLTITAAAEGALGLGLAAGLVAAGVLLGQPRSLPALVGAVTPTLGAAGGALLAQSSVADPVVVLLGGCLGAAAVALTGRAQTATQRQLARVWAVGGAAVGLAALLALVSGLELPELAALLLAGVVLLPRVLPGWVVTVDDTVLLDIGRLSVTSWSPRERRSPVAGARSRWRIDAAGVAGLVRTARAGQVAALTGLAVVSAGSSALVSGRLVQGWRWPEVGLLTAALLALSLGARAYRHRADRVLLRLAALGPALGLAMVGVWLLPAGAAVAVAAATAVLAAGLSRAAPAVAGGYASLGLARLADVAEGLSIVVALPLALWVAGLLGWLQGLLG